MAIYFSEEFSVLKGFEPPGHVISISFSITVLFAFCTILLSLIQLFNLLGLYLILKLILKTLLTFRKAIQYHPLRVPLQAEIWKIRLNTYFSLFLLLTDIALRSSLPGNRSGILAHT